MLHWTYKGWNCFSTIEIIMLQYELPTNHWWKFKEKNLLLHNFSNSGINDFCCGYCEKGVSQYKGMDDWTKSNENS